MELTVVGTFRIPGQKDKFVSP